jgi:membrane protease YdiL (CAAX protease family)
MGNTMKNKDLQTALIFGAIGLVAGYFTGLYQASIATEELKQQILSGVGSMQAMMLIAAAQAAVYAFLSAFIGLKLARRVNLRLNFAFDKNAFVTAILIGLAVAFIITGSDRFIFAQYLPAQVTQYVFSPVYLTVGILYGGIVEELLLRLLVMTLLVLILWKLFARSKESKAIPSWIYITAIFLAAGLFAAGHLPITAQTLGLSTPIIIRCFVLNGIGGIGFGYLYWKNGLSYAMYAHASTHVFMQVLFMPVFF